MVILGLMLLANCATAISTKGARIDENAVKQIQIGKSTRSDILKMFGAELLTLGLVPL